MLGDYQNLGLGIAMALEPRETPGKREILAKAIAADRLLLESDWPFLRMRYDDCVERMTQLGMQIADWRGVEPGALRDQLAANARDLYHFSP